MIRRNTPSKQMVLQLLEASSSALSQDILEQQVKDKMDRVTIYRVLNRFCEDGIAHKIVSDDGKYYFALCRGCKQDHHSHEHVHFRCVRCQKVECLPGKLNPKLPEGYQPVYANYWVSGYCKSCS
jgi:Fur family ferric uptake transcriptional regulator